MKGTVVSWKDDKGFGFIRPDDGGEQVFFHISSVKKTTRKPQLGDPVIFEVGHDAQGRPRAAHVLLEGVALAKPGYAAGPSIVTEPVRKDWVDYAGYLMMTVLAAASIAMYLRAGSAFQVAVPGALAVLLFLFVTGRKKTPPNKQFSCAKCRSVSTHDHRTILAWKSGRDRLYCSACHHAWLRQQPSASKQNSSAHSAGRSGCLGLFLVLASAPIVCVVTAVMWFA